MSAGLGTITDDSFAADVLQNPGFVLVDFWAPTCGPCKMIAPYLEELAKEYDGRLKIGKVDVFDNEGSANTYKVRNIPCLVLFKGGQEKSRVVGARNKVQLKAWLDEQMTA